MYKRQRHACSPLEALLVDSAFDADVYPDEPMRLSLIHIFPTADEIARNPRARSAKLRVAQKL